MDTKDDSNASLDKLDFFKSEMLKVDEFIVKQTKFYDDKKSK